MVLLSIEMNAWRDQINSRCNIQLLSNCASLIEFRNGTALAPGMMVLIPVLVLVHLSTIQRIDLVLYLLP